MAGAGSRSRERVPTIDEVKNDHYSNIMQATFGDNAYLIAVKDSVQVDLTSFRTESELRTWVMANLASVRVFDINSRGRLTRELSRRDISELPLPEEAPAVAAQAVAAPVVEHLRLGKETNARTRQVIRALESRTYEGITFPGTRGVRAEFFQQFSVQEKDFLQRAWDFAGTKERELFAAELNAFFAEAGDGKMGMLTLAKILQRMASDYLSHQGAYAQSRFFTIADFYYYASDIMEDEKTVGGAREHTIGSIGREMKGAVHRRYVSLIGELKEERRALIARRLPGLEQVPTPAETAQVEAPEAQVEAAPVQLPSALDKMYMQYSLVEFYQQMIGRLPADSPQLPNLMASMRAAEEKFLEFVQGQPQEVQDAAKWRIQAINDRRAAEGASVAVPVAAPVEAAPMEAASVVAPVETYDYEKFQQIADRIDRLVPEEYQFSDPRILDTGLFPDTAEEVHVLYNEIRAHFADMEALLAAGRLTSDQVTLLTRLRASVEKALGIVP